MKKLKMKIYHWDFIVTGLLSLYLVCYGIFFLYRKGIYYNYILLFLLGFFLGFKIAKKLFDDKGDKYK